MKAKKIAIVTVHGTGDTATSPDGPKWFQRGSAFTEQLKQRVEREGMDVDIVPHLWSGANSASGREVGADRLADLIRKLYNRYDGIHVIGHSHGGNVANDAAVLLKWGLRRSERYERFDSLVTIGTPFFNQRTGWLQMLAGVIFLGIAWGSVIFLPLMAAIFGYMYFAPSTPDERTTGLGVLVYVAIAVPCVWFMLVMSRQGIRRILRPRAGGKSSTSIFSIWHPNDEAISFLQRVEELQLEPFPRGSLFRGSRGAAIGIGVLMVIAVGLANPFLYAFGLDLLDLRPEPGQEDFALDLFGIAVAGLVLAPVVFTAVYLTYRAIVGGVVQELAARGTMNRFVGGVMRGVAMGRDGDQVLFNIGPRSHTHLTEEYIVAGECAARMQERANGTAGQLIEKYRWSLFSVSGDTSASLTALTTDTMTWDSLIHTMYFEQPEVQEAIGAYIAAKARGDKTAAPRALAA